MSIGCFGCYTSKILVKKEGGLFRLYYMRFRRGPLAEAELAIPLLAEAFSFVSGFKFIDVLSPLIYYVKHVFPSFLSFSSLPCVCIESSFFQLAPRVYRAYREHRRESPGPLPLHARYVWRRIHRLPRYLIC